MNDRALVELVKIVYAADVSADIDMSPNGRELKAIASGLQSLHGKVDDAKIAPESPMHDTRYAFCQKQSEGSSSSD